MSEPTELVTYKQWDDQAKRIERHNLRRSGESLTFTAIERRASKYILEIRDDQKTMVVKKGWRAAMRGTQ
ncbi:MAG: hypothetical protein ACYTEQ_28605 [Planctomycetota bacterium]|jgi:hypothetical protein